MLVVTISSTPTPPHSSRTVRKLTTKRSPLFFLHLLRYFKLEMSHEDTLTFTPNPLTPNRQLRHRSSLAHAFNFTLVTPDPEPREIEEADFIYLTIADDCGTAGILLEFRVADDCNDGSHNASDDLVIDHEEDEYTPSGVVYLHRFLRALHEHSPPNPAALTSFASSCTVSSRLHSQRLSTAP